MKSILFTLLLSYALFASVNHTAKILESMDSAGYTYIKVKEGDKELWIAMTQRAVKVGESISFTEQAWMSKFHSKTLNRTFETILFASDMIEPKEQIRNLADLKTNVMTSKYKEKDTITLAELYSNSQKYIGKTVTIKGAVTKVSIGIIKRNWVHISDGSRFGNAQTIVFTTEGDVPKVGDVVSAKGVVEKDVDFGFGYFYPVIVQKSSFK